MNDPLLNLHDLGKKNQNKTKPKASKLILLISRYSADRLQFSEMPVSKSYATKKK